MAGHSHWARIKRAKAVTDARRGRAWSKLSRAIIMAARGGGDPDANLTLRYAIEAAKAENMPRDTIERAIKKGTGELGGESIEEIVYEAYSPGGAALWIQVLSDNRNRTAGELRNILDRRGGNLATSGSVGWMFAKRGVVLVPATAADEERLTDIALQVGADDVRGTGEAFEITCDTSIFEALRRALAQAGIATESAEIAMLPSSTVPLTGDAAARTLELMQELEDHDDVQKIYSNFEISEGDLERFSG